MNLIDKDKLLYKLSCAVFDCSQDDYEKIENIINKQPIICELNDTVLYNKYKDLLYKSNSTPTAFQAKWKYNHYDSYNHYDVYICSNCGYSIKCGEEESPSQLGYRCCPNCRIKIIDDEGV